MSIFTRYRLLFGALVVGGLVVISCVALPAVPEPGPTPSPPPTHTAVDSTGGGGESHLLPAESPPFSTVEWKTDFSRRIVPWEQIRSGGPPKDGIPAIDEPAFDSVAAAQEWLSAQDPIILVEHNGDARAYPLKILIWHEIVNDEVGGKPVTVTFCPLCNASIVFDRQFADMVLDFGTTGRLRNSDLVMYDRQTETWWQQFTGEGLIGQFAGHQLTFLGSQVVAFADFATTFPDGKVLKIPDARRSYGRNPYVNYDSGAPFLFDGELDPRLPPTERVMGVELNGVAKAYGFDALAAAGVLNDELGGEPLVVFHKFGTASALDSADISAGRDVGSAALFHRAVDGRVLTFEALSDGFFADVETGSTWNLLGQAIAGELRGRQLERLLAFDHFWFAWRAFYPQTELYE